MAVKAAKKPFSVHRNFLVPLLTILIAVGITDTAGADDETIELNPIGTFESGLFDQSAAEIVAYDPETQRVFIVNAQAAGIDVIDISVPSTPALVTMIDVRPFGAKANSVAVHDGVVAVAAENEITQDPGQVVFFDTDGQFLSAVTVGALPDMLTFTRNGNWVLVANEGEPNDAYSVDPEGSVSIIDVSDGAANVTQSDVRTADFTKFNNEPLDPSIRIFGPNATVAQDLEPEFITTSHDSKTAWVTLQENNAIGILDIRAGKFTELVGLGFKDHSIAGNGFDASNRDGRINIRPWPTRGMFQPDAIASYRLKGDTFLVTANEGDSRDFAGFSEEERVKGLLLDPVAFPNASALQDEAALGRLKVTAANGDTDGDGDFDQLFSFGARSFSIWTASGVLVFDSADDFEQITAREFPDDFNSTNDENNSFDDRSDDKGPEPEGVVLGEISGRTFAFIGLERIGGIMVYDITDPADVSFVQYINTRDFSGEPVLGTAGDLGPEGLAFVREEDSPIGKPLLVVGHEVSGTTTIFEINRIDKDDDDDESED